jgi:hypothetical protein
LGQVQPAQTPAAMTDQTRTYELEAGMLTLRTTPPPGRALFQVAERINPKRAFLFVSTVLGRHIPVDPVEHRAVLRTLATGVSGHLLSGPVFVMGFAETAVGIGAGVFDCLAAAHPDRAIGYLTTTRFAPNGATPWFMIRESHSHAVDHIILTPRAGVVQQGRDATLILVDDETSTGNTFAELAAGLQAQGLVFGRVVLVTLTDWSGGRAAATVTGIFGGADVREVSLQKGVWDWAPKPAWVHAGLPDTCAACCPLWHPDGHKTFAAPRTGLAVSDCRLSGAEILAGLEASGLRTAVQADRVLVVGAGEHVWQPMLVAEAFAARGNHTRFITTTRSPIKPGETILHKMVFPDHYGQGFRMYMHNVEPGDWDRILLFTETGAAGVSDRLVNWLGAVDVIDGAGAVHSGTAAGYAS